MESKDIDNLYQHYEDLKNSLYRELSGASKRSILWPRFIYNWFYVNEKTLYNIYTLRQQLGTEIHDDELREYNSARKQILPRFNYTFYKKRKVVNGTSIDELDYSKPKAKMVLLSLLTGYFCYSLFGLRKYWLLYPLCSYLLFNCHDRYFYNYSELENGYKYIYERRVANSLYKSNVGSIVNEYQTLKLSENDLYILRHLLILHNSTLPETIYEMNVIYLKHARMYQTNNNTHDSK